MYLLDTNVVSELRKGSRADAKVRAWANKTPAGLYRLSIITLLELEIGVLRMERRDTAQGAVLRKWLEEWVLVFSVDSWSAWMSLRLTVLTFDSLTTRLNSKGCETFVIIEWE